jgi:hypothetical protein
VILVNYVPKPPINSHQYTCWSTLIHWSTCYTILYNAVYWSLSILPSTYIFKQLHILEFVDTTIVIRIVQHSIPMVIKKTPLKKNLKTEIETQSRDVIWHELQSRSRSWSLNSKKAYNHMLFKLSFVISVFSFSKCSFFFNFKKKYYLFYLI